MDFYQSLGNLILGSRLRRLSDYYLNEINKVYLNLDINFEASWFPLFYLLSTNPSISIREISDNLQVSHSAISQLVSSLKNKGLVITTNDQVDGRRQLVQLTAKGQELLQIIKPIWKSISETMEQLNKNNPAAAQLLNSIQSLEMAFSNQELATSILQKLSVQEDHDRENI